jgi:hypothetical protein
MTTSTESKSASVHLVSAVLLVVAVALAVLVVLRAKQHQPAQPERAQADPMLLVPAGPRLLISADIISLMKVVANDLARLGGDKLLGLRQTCGFEPLLSLERAVFSMPFSDAPGAGRGSDFAFIAETSIDAKLGLKCAELVITKRGGSPARANLGAFTSVRDLKKPPGEMALRPDGLFVLSGGQYFRDVMDAGAGVVNQDDAATLRTQLHRSIRDKLGRAQLKLTMLPEASSMLHGVLALGLGLEVADDITLRGLVACSSEPACSKAREVVEDAKTQLAKDPQLSGLASLQVEQRGERLELGGRLPREQLGPLLTHLITP